MERLPYWSASQNLPSFPELQGDFDADVVVVGAGITGLTAALLLQRAEKQVIVIEARKVGRGDTGNSTAHLTEVLDTRYYALEAKFGPQGARMAADATRAAINYIEAMAGNTCDFARLPGYLFAETDEQVHDLRREFESLRRAGAEAEFLSRAPVPWTTLGAIRVDRQAQLDPVKYLQLLADQFVAAGGRIFENSAMTRLIDDEPCVVHTSQGAITARDVLVLTQVPVSNRLFIHTKLAAYRSYVLAGSLPQGHLEQALFWDMHHPYHYIRRHDRKLLIGGEDHKTGQDTNTEARFASLEAYAHEKFPGIQLDYRWSGQIIEPADGLPFIGRNTASHHVYVATGFSGNGMTFGAVAGLLLADAVLDVRNDWTDLFTATRVKPLAQAVKYMSENINVAAHMATDVLAAGEVDEVSQIEPGQGKLMRDSNGEMLAVCRNQAGTLSAVSALCTHLGCHVHWNTAEQTWDCACHGGRFDANGRVLNGPPIANLKPAMLKLPDDDNGRDKVKHAKPARKKRQAAS